MIHHRLRGLPKGGGAADVADVFSVDLYTGNGSTQTITNGIDLAGEGGLVWIKSRSSADHQWFDTVRGATKELISNSKAPEATDSDTLTSFGSTGFSLGADANVNTNSTTYVGFTFRQAPKFFDVVQFTTNGLGESTFTHDLESNPGMVIMKAVSELSQWIVYHRYNSSKQLYLDASSSASIAGAWITNNSVSSITISSGEANRTYIAYLFAHDPDGVIQCGSYTGNGSATGPTVTLGWEPQYLLIKNASATGNWVIYDNARGMPAGGSTQWPELLANTANAEDAAMTIDYMDVTATGFQIKNNQSELNADTNTYIYMAIKKAS